MPNRTETVIALPFRELVHPEIAQIRVYPTPELTAIGAADAIVNLVLYKPQAVITYATGQTMEPVYARIAQQVGAGRVRFDQTLGFHLDERHPIPSDHPSSFVGYMRKRVYTPFGIPPANRFEIDGTAVDPREEANRYNSFLRLHPIDLAIIGLGPPDAPHIGFNEPGTPFNWETHFVENLAPGTIVRDTQERGEKVPAGAITQGPANIFAAENIFLILYGTKGRGLNEALYQPIVPLRPASGLRLPDVGPKVTIFIDQAAAAVLTPPEQFHSPPESPIYSQN